MNGARRWRLLADEDDAERELLREQSRSLRPDLDRVSPLAWWWAAAVVAVAAVPRLIFIFLPGQPENAGVGMYGDVYHHWQIAYLTWQVGLGHGPRLWDLKGLEYFWGVLHPLLMAAVFTVAGSSSIVLDRLVSTVFGCLVVLLVLLLCRRYWGLHVALPAAAFAAFAPTSVFNDASGMVEPVAVALCLVGIWLLPGRSFLAGIAWGLAAMARAEAWVFALGLVVATALHPATRRAALNVAVGWGAAMLVYMKVLLDQTGNPIYPFYWNFLANAAGRWEAAVRLTHEQEAVRPVLGLFLMAAAAGLAWTLVRRPRGYLLLTFGFGYWVLVAGTLGFTAYLRSWVGWMWMTRVFAFPYDFAAVLAALGLLHLLPRWRGRGWRAPAAAVSVAAILAVQLAWLPIAAMYSGTFPAWAGTVGVGERIGAVYRQPGTEGGGFAVPADHPDLTYTLAQYGHVAGRHLVSQLYDPFYYLPPGTTYRDHPAPVGTLLQCWLDATGTTLIAIDRQNANYLQFAADHPGWLIRAGDVAEYHWTLYRVRVPGVPAATCRSAARALEPR